MEERVQPGSHICFSNISNMSEKSVLNPFPHTQHRPICVSGNTAIVAQPTTFRRRFNMKKARTGNDF